MTTEREQAVRDAVASVRRDFPFPGYFELVAASHEEIAEIATSLAPPGGRILDVGAGPLDKTAVLARLGFRMTAYDDLADDWHDHDRNRERILEFASVEGIDYVVAPAPIPAGPFSVVMAHDILEHIPESPRHLLNDLVEQLETGGYLFVSVPNAANSRKRFAVLLGRTNYPSYDAWYWWPTTWRGHIREYVRDDLAALARNLGLEVVTLRGTHHLLTRARPIPRLAHLALSSVFDGLRDSWILVARKPPGWAPALEPDPELSRRLLAEATPYTYR